MNKRQAKKGINPHGSWRKTKPARLWQPIYTTPRWRKRAKWLWKIERADKEYEVEVVTRCNCMMCGKELTEGLFFCKECEKAKKEGNNHGEEKLSYKKEEEK